MTFPLVSHWFHFLGTGPLAKSWGALFLVRKSGSMGAAAKWDLLGLFGCRLAEECLTCETAWVIGCVTKFGVL